MASVPIIAASGVVEGYPTFDQPSFNGIFARSDVAAIPAGYARSAQNVNFDVGAVGTRFAFTTFWNPAEAIGTIYNWIKSRDSVSTAGSYLIYFNSASGAVKMVPNMLSPSPVSLFTAAGRGISIAEAGNFLFICVFDQNGDGVAQCRVVGIYGSAVNTDIAFQGPIPAVPTVTNTGTGVVTAGPHRFAFQLQTRNGFVGPLSPYSAGLFAPASLTAPGGQQVNFQVSATWPADAAIVYPCWTSSLNLNRYLRDPDYPNGVAVPAGAPFTINILLNRSDSDLSANGTDVTSLNNLTQDSGGAGPFNPFSVFTFGDRIGYLADVAGISRCYFSEPSNYQFITADQHVTYLPGYKKMKCGFQLGSEAVILGPHWTYAFTDTGGVPVSWPLPRKVDGGIGTLSPTGVAVNEAGGLAWVADEGGLQIYTGGSFLPRPISYNFDNDWRKINWTLAAGIQIADFPDLQFCLLAVPMGATATANTNIMCVNYSRGIAPDTVDYSLWNIDSFTVGAIARIQNPSTLRMEAWVANAQAGAIMRQMNAQDDATPFNEAGLASSYQIGNAVPPNMQIGAIYKFMGMLFRIVGNGQLSGSTSDLDGNNSIDWSDQITLAPGGQTNFLRRFFLASEGASHTISMSGANQWFRLSLMRTLYSKLGSFRP